MRPKQMSILVFDGVEVLDFAGPFEVFSRTRLTPGMESRRTDESAPFRVETVSVESGAVRATGGLTIQPDRELAGLERTDWLLVPGGFGVRPLLEQPETIQAIQRLAKRAEGVASVCTGALLLAKAGLLSGQRATTHFGSYDSLAAIDPSIEVVRDVRFVEGNPITSAGVAAGIDMSFQLVERLCGREVADETARYIEYPRVR